jgi:hypothetical protein
MARKKAPSNQGAAWMTKDFAAKAHSNGDHEEKFGTSVISLTCRDAKQSSYRRRRPRRWEGSCQLLPQWAGLFSRRITWNR